MTHAPMGVAAAPDPGRPIKALFLGALTGASLVTLWFGLSGGLMGRPVDQPAPGPLESLLVSLPLMMVTVFPVALIIWLVGLFLVATPGWWLLHKIRLRSLPIAIVYGFVLSALAVWLILGGPTSGTGSGTVLGASLLVGGSGALVAIVVWRIAYRERASRR